ncbi:unnamed protein product [Rodentolepis nana]|uniref:F-box domain-containing protein n=1 Tax=Rodentolepis nana TaxID=102285 RepID=A0A0R3T851_RODNA|nr:unnamed protein product [Rodentolepis nana]
MTTHSSSEHSRISILPYQVTTQIFKDLSSCDILNFCSAFPQWRSFPESKKATRIFNQDIENWTWIDKHLYNLLLPKKSSNEFNNTVEAIRYYYNYNVCIKGFEYEKARIGSSLCECILTGNLPLNSKVPLNFDSTVAIDDRDINELHLEYGKMAAFTLDGYNYDTMFYYKPLLWKRRRNIEVDSCVIHFAHSFKQDCSDLKDIFVDLRPDQTAIIAIVKDSKRQLRGYKSNIDFLTGFLENEMGGFEDSPLAKTKSNWCLWLLESDETKFLNIMDVYKWSSFHILKRRMNLQI